MTQPFNRLSVIEPQGVLDVEAGELWVSNPWELMSEGVNLSAYERNRLFFNYEGREFIDLSYQSGADIDSDSRSAIAADFDRDGDLDLLVASVGGGPLRLFMNQIPSDGKSVRVLLEGTKSNRQGVGTRLQIEVGSRRIVRDVFPANGLMGQHPTETVIGVGAVNEIDRLLVHWPSGHTQTFQNVPVGGILQIREDAVNYQSLPR
ncbi:MAG: hypothetical protein CMJ70_19275 [Planctomycetaceae bacterium]|nr:hypothetical protein [Planctomycetaceae bacterium]HAA71378.1 hypothetical protein [Planctomycetaceae bacterium]